MTEEKRELELLLEKMSSFEKKRKRSKMITGSLVAVCTVCLSVLFFYFRLFHTEFELVNEDGLRLKYSTAWVVRYPAEYEGKQITRVTGLKDIAPHTVYAYIEEGITNIQDFDDSSLMCVRIPDTVTEIEYAAFADNKNLIWVDFPEKMENELSIGRYAFQNTAIHRMILPEGVISIGEEAFANCKRLKHVEIPDTTEKVGGFLFFGCQRLEYVRLPASMKYIGDQFFYECERLEEIVYPQTLEACSILAFSKSSFWDKPVSELGLPESVYFANTGEGYFLDIEKENQYLSEKSGIPLEIIEQSEDTDEVWIEGKWYSFSMTYEEFLKQDSWEVIEEIPEGEAIWDSYFLRHTETGRKIQLIGLDEYVFGCILRGDNSCLAVVPGGIICNVSNMYRIYTKNEDAINYHFDEVEYHDEEWFYTVYVEELWSDDHTGPIDYVCFMD